MIVNDVKKISLKEFKKLKETYFDLNDYTFLYEVIRLSPYRSKIDVLLTSNNKVEWMGGKAVSQDKGGMKVSNIESEGIIP